MEASALDPAPSQPAQYPVRVDADRQDEYVRFLPLIKWLLAFPHYIVLAVLFIGVFFAHLIAFFAVIFTRTYPRGLFNYNVGVFRWSWRVTAYVQLLRDQYPPFSLGEDPGYPAYLEIDYPEDGIDRWRPLVQWLLVIPFMIVVYLLSLIARVATFIGLLTIIFTKEIPAGIFNFIVVAQRWATRAFAYGAFLVDRYPPFDFDELSAPHPESAPAPSPPAP
jgi:Domain of unknown function (DUF4389)